MHNVGKVAIGERVAAWMLGGQPSTPALASVTAEPRGHSAVVTVTFSGGGKLRLAPTLHCAACCSGPVGDFDASCDDGVTYVNGSLPVLVGDQDVRFTVPCPKPTHVRYVGGNQPFPQCAVKGATAIAPAQPFVSRVSATGVK